MSPAGSIWANRNLVLAGLVLSAIAVIVIVLQLYRSPGWFVEHPFPLAETQRLFDIGVVDANGDDLLDVYTSNHHFRQVLLIADGKGGYYDSLSEWGLDQSKEFPLAELSFVAPTFDKSGLYIYWFGTQLIIRAYKIADPRAWLGTLRVNDPVDIMRNVEFSVQKQGQTSLTSETVIEFSPSSNGFLRMRPGGQGLPIKFDFSDTVPPKQIYVGRGMIAPSSTSFSLAMRDRHAMAWADYNADGVLDVFINRGALAGTLKMHSVRIRQRIRDELLVSQGAGKYVDIVSEVGIRKKDCSGRHARWLDFDNNGLLDLFVNCHDRGNVVGRYPKQLYRQDERGLLNDVAEKVGLAIPDDQIASFAWYDVDNDTDLDVLTFQDEGLRLYRNIDGHYVRESIVEHSSAPDQKIGETRGTDWFFDGKITIADYNADGDMDAFSASKRGNVLLMNKKGSYIAVDPPSIGLPKRSYTANWVDYDNDGLVDLFLVPQGLYQQQEDHNFRRVGILAIDPEQYKAAICNWFDLDNDGRLDVLMALSEERDFKRWWEFSPKPRSPDSWRLVAYQNVGSSSNHWLQVKVVGKKGNPEAIGAHVKVYTGKNQQTQEVGGADGAFFSQGHYRLYFGLGQHKNVNRLTVRWPDGHEEILEDVPADRLITVKRSVEYRSNLKPL